MRSKGKHTAKHSAKLSFADALELYKIEILEVALVLAILGKLVLFYHFMGTGNYFVPVVIVTAIFILIPFGLIRKKLPWLAVTLFGLITIFMFADAVFCGYFGRYLSVNMAGNAEVLGDIGECIKQAMKPYYFLLFLDFIGVTAFEIYLKKSAQEFRNLIEIPDTRHILLISKLVVIILLLVAFVVNPLGSGFCQSVSHAEFFSFHIKDFCGIDDGLDLGDVEYENEEGYFADPNDPIFGLAEDRNLIVIQLESFMNFVIGKSYQGIEITPNINKLLEDQDTIYFDNYYQQVGAGNTSDAEFATNNSIMGSNYSYTYALYYENYFKGLPWLLKEKGYTTNVYHGYNSTFWNRERAYPNLGFDNFICQKDFKKGKNIGWGICDVDFFKQSVDMMKKQDAPFYDMLITLSGHYPYNMGKENQVFKEDKVINAAFAKYLDAVHYTDEAVGVFMKELKKSGLAEKSVIAMYGDHQGFTIENTDYLESFENILGRKAGVDDQMNIPLIINVPGASRQLEGETLNRTISISGGQTDFMPTICYLLGFDELNTYYMGQNLLRAKSGFVAEKYYAATGTFFMDDIVFDMSNDYVFSNSHAYNRKTRASVNIDQYYDSVLKAGAIVTEANRILVDDVLRFTIGGQNESDYVAPKHVKRNMDGSVYVPGQENQTVDDPTMKPVEGSDAPMGEDTNIVEGSAGVDGAVETSGGAIDPLSGAEIIDGGVEDWLTADPEPAPAPETTPDSAGV